jgi:hypothetical protein
MRLIVAIIVVIAFEVAGLAGLAYSGLPDVSASGSESAGLRWFLQTTREQASNGVPRTLSSRTLTARSNSRPEPGPSTKCAQAATVPRGASLFWAPST